MTSNFVIVGVAGCVACVLFAFYRIYLQPKSPLPGATDQAPQILRAKAGNSKGEGDDPSVFLAENITPLPDFQWQETEPLKMRPFKAKYHLTMGLSNLPISQLLEFDRNYLTRLKLRREVIRDHADVAIQASPDVKGVVDEFYVWLVGVYLPTRYPTIFILCPTTSVLLNQATNETLPLQPDSDVKYTLKILGENLDEDFLFLTLDDDEKEGGESEYRLKAYVTCFPSGFNTKEKFGMRLSEIHGPVPGYKEKLQLSMGRFFGRVGVGRVVGRGNWSITTTSDLFTPGGTHLYEGEKVDAEEEVDIANTYLRTERQTLHRLPHTKALVFAFKTYLYPISEIKEEGNGEVLAQAIEGLKEGSVPEIYFYKRGVVWGEVVKQFLRGEGVV